MCLRRPLIAALSNGKLQFEVMKHELQNVGAALSHAIKLEAYEQSLSAHGSVVDRDDGRAKCRSHAVCAAVDLSEAGESIPLHSASK